MLHSIFKITFDSSKIHSIFKVISDFGIYIVLTKVTKFTIMK